MIKKFMPKSLFARTLLILFIPTVLVQVVTTYVFYDRHWQTLARRLSSTLGGDIALVANLVNNAPPERKAEILAQATRDLHMQFSLSGEKHVPKQESFDSLVDAILYDEIAQRVENDFYVNLRDPNWVRVMVEMEPGVLTVQVNKNRLFSYTSNLVIAWMVGSSVLLFGIAAIFLRNQIRPIRKLAIAAEKLGKGQEANDLKPSGAIEIRAATMAFRIMRDRIRRQIQQRTEMLAGISHDLRTPLTRLKLELALLPPSADIQAMQGDVDEMRQMVDSYLDFARGDSEEESQKIDLSALVEEVARNSERDGYRLEIHVVPGLFIHGRPAALKRALGNLIGNACRYGTQVSVSMQRTAKGVAILVDDNGPGIPESAFEEVFKPFRRLDDSRNSETGGVGLGLSIARDIARGHGGDIVLAQSEKGGLKAALHLPV